MVIDPVRGQQKIKSSILYLRGKKHTKVSNSSLVRLSPSTVSDDPVDTGTTGVPNNARPADVRDAESASADHV